MSQSQRCLVVKGLLILIIIVRHWFIIYYIECPPQYCLIEVTLIGIYDVIYNCRKGYF